MKHRQRSVTVGLIVVLLGWTWASAQENGWQLSFEVLSSKAVLMEPVWGRVTLRSVSSHALPEVQFWGRFYLDGNRRPCRSDLAPPDESVPPAPGGNPEATPLPFPSRPPGWERSEMINLGDVCNLVRRAESVIGEHRVCYRDDASPGLLTRSSCVSFEIMAPQGIDKQAYEALGHDPLGDSERYGELLSRFPTSTYAAYVVWNRYAKGWAQVETERTITGLSHPYPFRTELAPCDATGAPTGGHETRFGPEGVFRCRTAWMERVLRSHADIWFADEVRLRLALDRYLLGDKDACAAGLEALAAHGRPYVAAKARELLAAMRAGGMLPGAGG